MEIRIKCIDNVKYTLTYNDIHCLKDIAESVYESINEQTPFIHNTYNNGVLTRTIVINSKHIISVEVEE